MNRRTEEQRNRRTEELMNKRNEEGRRVNLKEVGDYC